MVNTDTMVAFERSPSDARHSLILLRWTLFLAAAAILISNHLFEPLPASAMVLLAAFAASNVLLYFFWDRYTATAGTDIVLAVVDTMFISLGIVYSGVEPTELRHAVTAADAPAPHA